MTNLVFCILSSRGPAQVAEVVVPRVAVVMSTLGFIGRAGAYEGIQN
jgi:hypothetical protein|tara:strand:+ start:268 stop:408 length:141 start_codon:yes stop_codon:yes gene_type:complete